MNPVLPTSQAFLPSTGYSPLGRGSVDGITKRDSLFLLLVLIVAIVPRAITAFCLGAVCDDAYIYTAVADAYAREDFRMALWYLNINLYPILLLGFENLGFDPLSAGQVWGVVLATATILPLWGWLRRVLDRRVAFAACGLYAVHPEFIEVSAEPIRDSTFWFLTALGLYFIWRAAAERRLWLYAAAGLAVAFAAHTRSEGWLLVLPATAWPFIAANSIRSKRKAFLGLVVSYAMVPLFIVCFNLTILKNHNEWELGKLDHFRLAIEWVADITKLSSSETPERAQVEATLNVLPNTAAQPVVSPEAHATGVADPSLADLPPLQPIPVMSPILEPETEQPSFHRNISEYADAAVHALEPVPLLLMFAGSIVGCHLLLRREHLVLSAMCMAILLGVWVRLTTLGEINGRYFLACFFPAAGSAGLGVIWTLAFLERRASRYMSGSSPAVVAVLAIIAVSAVHVGESLANSHPSRERETRIGLSLRERFGIDQTVVVLPPAARVAFSVGGQRPILLLDDTPIEVLVEKHAADLVILEDYHTPRSRFNDLTAILVERGWTPCDIHQIPDSEHFKVFTRPQTLKTATANEIDLRRLQ